MNWFRFYHTALDDPKVQLLEPVLFKAWVNLLCLASQSEPRGSLPGTDAIAFRLRTDADTAADICSKLEGYGLLDDDYARVVVHDWDAWQRNSDDVTARVTKHRQGKKQHETLHETGVKRDGNVLEQNRAEQSRTEQTAATVREKPPPSLYAETLNGSLPRLESMFQGIDQLFTPAWLAKELADAAAVIGPLSREQLGRGLDIAVKQIERQMAAKTVRNPRPFAHKLIVDYLTEQRDEHHAA
jgi:hypothetical protein